MDAFYFIFICSGCIQTRVVVNKYILLFECYHICWWILNNSVKHRKENACSLWNKLRDTCLHAACPYQTGLTLYSNKTPVMLLNTNSWCDVKSSACCCDEQRWGGTADNTAYPRFSGLKARFRSVSTYLVHFFTALGLVMKGLASSPFLWISAPFLTHRFTSVTPDISFPWVPPKIATLRASSKHTLPLSEDMAGLVFLEPRRRPAVSVRSKSFQLELRQPHYLNAYRRG